VWANANKFAPENGTITVEFGFDEGASQLFIEVRDSGIGIAEDKIANIMNSFYQIDEVVTRSHEGSGLGLAHVNSMTGLHGGEIAAKSEKRNGTIVRIRFPKNRTFARTGQASEFEVA